MHAHSSQASPNVEVQLSYKFYPAMHSNLIPHASSSGSQSDDNFVQMITVGDCNDEPPVFTDTTYDFSVIENAASGPISGPTISSTDADSTTPNQAVTYHAIDLGPDSWFDITTEVSMQQLVHTLSVKIIL